MKREYVAYDEAARIRLTAVAHTRSEARAAFKKALGIKPKGRLPTGFVIATHDGEKK